MLPGAVMFFSFSLDLKSSIAELIREYCLKTPNQSVDNVCMVENTPSNYVNGSC